MTIMDKELEFSDKQAITGNAVSENVLDFGPNRNVGPGTPLPLLIQVTEAFNNLTSLRFDFKVDDAEDMSGAVTLFSTTVPLADLVAGYRVPVHVVPDKMKRYARIDYVVTGAAPTTGRIAAGIVSGIQSNR